MPSDPGRGGGHGRRRFLKSVTALGGVVSLPTLAEAARPHLCFAGVDDLGLEAAQRADLEAFARPVLEEAAWLEELPLDDVDPAFVFVPRG
ncbi:MAG TPA: hypothetical protein VMR21_14440 [Vicinamibacteria bacterium]|nr:hypothetical protein [Vicinamibacteria bacterium]